MPRVRTGLSATRLLTAACAALLWAQARGAGDPTDTVQLKLNTGVLWDNNLFRLPEGDSRAFGVPPENRSDTIYRIGIGVKVDKTLSRQRLIGEINLDQNTFDRNAELDYVGGNVGARWLWEIGNPWSGEVSYDRRRYLTSFADLRAIIRNLVDVDTFAVTGRYRLHPRWRAWGGAKALETANSAATQRSLDIRVNTLLMGADYLTPADNSLGMQLRLSDASHPNRPLLPASLLINQYRDTEPSAVWTWNTTGRTRFDGRFGYLSREHEGISARDFSGPTLRANLTWLPTGKFEIGASAWRELLTWESQNTTYIVATGVRLTPVWNVTSKISLRTSLSYETRDYTGDPGSAIGLFPLRKDDLRSAQISAAYSPYRNAEILLVLEKSLRGSNIAIYEFNDETAYLNLKLNF